MKKLALVLLFCFFFLIPVLSIFEISLKPNLNLAQAQVCQDSDEICSSGCSIGMDNDCRLEELEKQELIEPVGYYKSQYSPWVMHKPGWQRHIIYYCKNTVENGVARDRIWRVENWEGGKFGEWVNDQIVIDGTLGEEDDLSCSPGVVIGQDGTWHMYYVTGNRDSDGVLYLYHATAPPAGLNWTKQGRVRFEGLTQPFPGYLETPSPILIDGQIILYFVGEQRYLYKAVSNDGFNFTEPQKLNAPNWAQAGRVTYKNGIYYYVYSLDPNRGHQPPTEIRLSISSDGVNFHNDRVIMFSDDHGWDGDRMWSPHLLYSNFEYKVYYAGNKGDYDWWGANTSLGLRWFSEIRDCRDNDDVCPEGCIVETDNDCTLAFTIQGYRHTCFEDTEVVLDGLRTDANNPYSFENVSVGEHTVSLDLGDSVVPYEVSYSPCEDCTYHPSESYEVGDSHTFNKSPEDFYDLWWKCCFSYDLDSDCQATSADLKVILSRYGTGDEEADLNGDGLVNGMDFGELVKLIQ